NVQVPLELRGESGATARARDLLARVGLGGREGHFPAQLSGGEQQRVAIARAAANHPRVILADEPTGNLDPATSELVFSALQSLIRDEGAAGLIATHNHDLARRADRIVTLKDGLVEPLTL
ncbi:MAG: ATP-binding cassette domain-containing protein, partial [Devosia sp.]